MAGRKLTQLKLEGRGDVDFRNRRYARPDIALEEIVNGAAKTPVVKEKATGVCMLLILDDEKYTGIRQIVDSDGREGADFAGHACVDTIAGADPHRRPVPQPVIRHQRVIANFHEGVIQVAAPAIIALS